MHAEIAGEVFAALGLDVVDLHGPPALDPGDLQPLGRARRKTGLLQADLEFAGLDRVDEPDRVGEQPAVSGGLDAQGPGALPVRSWVGLAPHPSEDPEAQQQRLHAPDVLLADHVDLDHGGTLPSGHEAFRLEDTTQVCRDDRQRRREQALRDPHLRAAGAQPPGVDELHQALAVEAGATAVQALVLSDDGPLVPMHVGQDPVQSRGDPRQLSGCHGHRLDGERPVGAFGILPDETVGLQPPGKSSLGDLALVDLLLAVGIATVPLQLVARVQTAGGHEPAGRVARAPPDEVIGRDVHGIPRLRVQAKHLLDAIGLGGHDRRDPVRVEDLGAHGILLDQPADRHQARRCAHECVIGLAR